jgi:hypothetical protein
MRNRSGIPAVRTSRDLLLLQIGNGRLLVVSCDAAGGIGSKRHDRVKVDARVVGRFTARVALMELLAISADPVSIAATLATEPEPSGNQVLKGIVDELRYAGFSHVPIICSTEKNVSVSQTGVGVTALGSLPSSRLKIGKCKPGDELVAIGEPSVRDEVLEGERLGLIADTRDVCKLRSLSYVHEMIPVGSRGISREARLLAKDSDVSLRINNSELDLKKSAGPSSVLLCAIASGLSHKLKRVSIYKPATTIGYFY